jgi:hypothetical protein
MARSCFGRKRGVGFVWDALPVDYRDDEVDVIDDGDDHVRVDLGDLRDLDDD